MNLEGLNQLYFSYVPIFWFCVSYEKLAEAEV